MFGTCSLRCVLLLWSLSWFLTYSTRLPQRRVSNCTALHDALASSSIPTFEVIDAFHCDTSTWPAPVVINRDLKIVGKTFEGRNPQINWGASSGGVVAGPTCHLVFQNLIFRQQAMGIGGIDMPFLDTRENATTRFVSIVVGVESCPHSLDNARVQSLTRSPRFPGVQNSTQVNSKTIHMYDVAIEWTRRNAAWHLLNSIFRCNVYRNAPVLDEHYMEVKDDESFRFDTQMEPLTNQSPVEAGSSSSSDDDGPDLALIALIAALGLIAVLVVVSFFALGRQRARRDPETAMRRSGIPQSLEEDVVAGSKTGPSEVWNLLDSDVSLESPLGHGEFGKVYKASWQGTTVAVKIIKHNDQYLRTNVGGGLFEAFIAKHISHPNVVQTYQISTKNPLSDAQPRPVLTPSVAVTTEAMEQQDKGSTRSGSCSSEEMFGCFDDPGPNSNVGRTRYETWIVLEYCDGGSLAQAITDGEFLLQSENQPGYKMGNIARTALEIAGAMNYLHSVRIIHGDLKPGNVLLKKDASDPRGFICKVGDFGLSKFLAEDSHLETFTCGTVTHMPPELLNEGKLSSASDVYSFGILLWEIVSGKKPFAGKTQAEIILSVINKRTRPSLPPNVPQDFSDLIKSCWTHDYTQRPTFPEIIDSLTVILKYYTKLEKDGTGSRPPPDALDTAGTVPRSSFFTSEDIERTEVGGRGVLGSEHRCKSFRIVPKKFSSLRGNRLTSTADAVGSSSTNVVFLESNKSLHLSLDGKQQNSVECVVRQD